jgi:hypothetical protein
MDRTGLKLDPFKCVCGHANYTHQGIGPCRYQIPSVDLRKGRYYVRGTELTPPTPTGYIEGAFLYQGNGPVKERLHWPNGVRCMCESFRSEATSLGG